MAKECETSKEYKIERNCIDDARQLWTIQEELLQNYRNYLIVLNSLLAAGSCALIGGLNSDLNSKIGVQCGISIGSVANYIILSILLAFILSAFASLWFMFPVIQNRGHNVHLCQFVLMMLTSHRFFAEMQRRAPNTNFSNISLLAAFKMVEHPKKHDNSFVEFQEDDNSHHEVAIYLWLIKTKCKSKFSKFDHARQHVNNFLLWMFIIIWAFMLLFLL